jgi:hypothetical protein
LPVSRRTRKKHQPCRPTHICSTPECRV